MSILGIGTDIVECLRIAQMIERHGELFITRVYTEHEIEYCSARKAATQHYAGRWAAKEAVLKALGTGWRGASVGATLRFATTTSGSPSVVLRGGARDVCEAAGIRHDAREHLPLPHHATACAIAEGRRAITKIRSWLAATKSSELVLHRSV